MQPNAARELHAKIANGSVRTLATPGGSFRKDDQHKVTRSQLAQKTLGRSFLHFEPPGADTHAWAVWKRSRSNPGPYSDRRAHDVLVVRGKKWIIGKSVLDLRGRRHLLCVPSHRDSHFFDSASTLCLIVLIRRRRLRQSFSERKEASVARLAASS